MQSTETKDLKKLIYGLAVILLATCFTAWFYYMNEPLNEDLGGYFYDKSEWIRITTFGQVIACVKRTYLIWSGRIPGYFLTDVSKLFPRAVQGVLCGVIFTANVILTVRIVVKDTLKTLSSPILFLTMYLALYWYRPGTGVNYRWEFVAIYSFSVTLLLLYYNVNCGRKGSVDHGIIVACLIQLLGFIAGMSHEIISFGLIILIGADWIVDMIRHRTRAVSLFRHTGLILGYLTGALAPGNVSRLTSQGTRNFYGSGMEIMTHGGWRLAFNNSYLPMSGTAPQMLSSAAATDNAGGAIGMVFAGYLDRLVQTYYMHRMTLIGVREDRGEFIIFVSVLILAIISVICMLRSGQKNVVKEMLINDIGYVVSAASSIFMWALVYWQPVYAVWLPTIFVYIVLLEFAVRITEFIPILKNDVIHFAIPIITIVFFAGAYRWELSSFSNTATERRTLIRYAQENNLDEIVVPRYDENLPEQRYSLYALNNQKEYDGANYLNYYGVRIVIAGADDIIDKE